MPAFRPRSARVTSSWHAELGQRPLELAEVGAPLQVQQRRHDLLADAQAPRQLGALTPCSRIAAYSASLAATSGGTGIIGRPLAGPGSGIGLAVPDAAVKRGHQAILGQRQRFGLVVAPGKRARHVRKATG